MEQPDLATWVADAAVEGLAKEEGRSQRALWTRGPWPV